MPCIHTNTFYSNPTPQGLLCLPSFHICNAHLNSKKLAPPSSTSLVICSISRHLITSGPLLGHSHTNPNHTNFLIGLDPARAYHPNWISVPCLTGHTRQLVKSSHSHYIAKSFVLTVNSLLGKFKENMKIFYICPWCYLLWHSVCIPSWKIRLPSSIRKIFFIIFVVQICWRTIISDLTYLKKSKNNLSGYRIWGWEHFSFFQHLKV